MAFLLLSWAAIRVDPLPEKGSRMASPAKINNFIHLLANSKRTSEICYFLYIKMKKQLSGNF